MIGNAAGLEDSQRILYHRNIKSDGFEKNPTSEKPEFL